MNSSHERPGVPRRDISEFSQSSESVRRVTDQDLSKDRSWLGSNDSIFGKKYAVINMWSEIFKCHSITKNIEKIYLVEQTLL